MTLVESADVDRKPNGKAVDGSDDQGFSQEIRDLAEMLSKLNPMAEEFVAPSLAVNNINININNPPPLILPPFAYPPAAAGVNEFMLQPNQNPFGNANSGPNSRRKGNFGHAKRGMNNRTTMAQREDVIRRTVHVSDIDQQVNFNKLMNLD